MGRRLRWAFYSLKKLVFYTLVGLLLWQGYPAMLHYLQPKIDVAALRDMEGRLREIDAASLQKALTQPRTTSLVFIYDSRGMLSRWYFSDMATLAERYAPAGLQPIFISTDSSTEKLAQFLASRPNGYNFTPLTARPENLPAIQGVLKQMGADIFYDQVPYMAIINGSQFLQDFSPIIIRTGKIEEVLRLALAGN